MLIDAVNRGVRAHWYWIILMPFGEWAYFFTHKIHDPQFQRLRGTFLRKKVTLKELEYRATRSPSLQNRLLFAQALHDHGNFQQSADLFKEILQTDSDEKRALFGLARCLMETKQTQEAIQALEELVERDFNYEDYSPGVSLAESYWETNERDKAIELMQRIVRKSQRLRHTLMLAQFLQQENQTADARTMLEEALLDHENSPKYIKRAERAWARQARTTLRSMPTP